MTPSPLIDVTVRGLLGRRRALLMLFLAAIPVLLGAVVSLRGGRADVDRVLGVLIVQTVHAADGAHPRYGRPRLGDRGRHRRLHPRQADPALGRRARQDGRRRRGDDDPRRPVDDRDGPPHRRGHDATPNTLAFAIACVAGGAAYAAVFVALSSLTARALVAGLVYVLLWEGALGGLLEGTRFLSIRQATLGVVARLGGRSTRRPHPVGVAAAVLTAAIVGSLSIASWRLARFEVRGGD